MAVALRDKSAYGNLPFFAVVARARNLIHPHNTMVHQCNRDCVQLARAYVSMSIPNSLPGQ